MWAERTVLIDYNEIDNFFRSLALKKAGFKGEVRAFERPQEGQDFLLNDQIQVPTCVFPDIKMPQLIGFDVAQVLAEALRPVARFRLFMLTSSNWTDDRRRAAAIPLIQGFMLKPLTAATAAELLSA